jgi:hypothetical protein
LPAAAALVVAMLTAFCTQHPGAAEDSGDNVAMIDEYMRIVSSAPVESPTTSQLTGLLENLVRAQRRREGRVWRRS